MQNSSKNIEQKKVTGKQPDSPTEDHNEVHDVPPVPEVGPFMENKAQGNDLYSSLKAEHPDEVRLCLLLLMSRRRDRQVKKRLL